jgi:hypothetical protein
MDYWNGYKNGPKRGKKLQKMGFRGRTTFNMVTDVVNIILFAWGDA